MNSQITGMVSINNETPTAGMLTIETEMVDVTLARKTSPDPNWTYVDSAGHYHALASDGTLPTLTATTEHRECGGACGADECEGYDVTVYECAICGAEVEPGRITTYPAGREFMPGRTSWTVQVPRNVDRGLLSVRVEVGDRTFFGVAERVSGRAEGGPDGIRVQTTLSGRWPLGERKELAA